MKTRITMIEEAGKPNGFRTVKTKTRQGNVLCNQWFLNTSAVVPAQKCQYLNCKQDAVKIRIASNGMKQPRCALHAGTKPYVKKGKRIDRPLPVSADRVIPRILVEERGNNKPDRRAYERQTMVLCLPELPAPKDHIACWRPGLGLFAVSKRTYQMGMKPQNVYQVHEMRELVIQYQAKFGPVVFGRRWVEV